MHTHTHKTNLTSSSIAQTLLIVFISVSGILHKVAQSQANNLEITRHESYFPTSSNAGVHTCSLHFDERAVFSKKAGGVFHVKLKKLPQYYFCSS